MCTAVVLPFFLGLAASVTPVSGSLPTLRDYGVHHFQFRGEIGTSQCIMHLFCRSDVNGTTGSIRGFAYVVRPGSYGRRTAKGTHILTNELGATDRVNVSLMLGPLGAEPMVVRRSERDPTTYPWTLTWEGDATTLLMAETLTVKGWTDGAPMSDLVGHAAARTQEQAPKVWFVSYQLWGLGAAVQALLIRLNIQWHAALGFDGLLLYATSSTPFVADGDLRRYIASGVLQLLSCREEDVGISSPRQPGGHVFPKAVLYNAALLAFPHDHLFYADADELLATLEPANVHTLLREGGCLHPTAVESNLLRFDSFCHACHTAVVSELHVWRQRRSLQVLHHYRHLKLTPDYYKSLVDARAVGSVWIHDADHHSAQGRGVAPPSCAFVVHLKHMLAPGRWAYNTGPLVANTTDRMSDFAYIVDWLWPLAQQAAP